MKMPLFLHPDESLKKVCKEEITKFGEKDLRALASDLTDTMHGEKGVGIAAPQIGVDVRMFIVDKEYTHNKKDLVVLNPKVELIGRKTVSGIEGCLSVPGVFGKVARYASVRMTFNDIYGAEHVLEATGMLARIIQHEDDHLNGVLFIQRAKYGSLKA